MREQNKNMEASMSILGPHVKSEIEEALKAASENVPEELSVGGRRVLLFTGEDAQAKAEAEHARLLEDGKMLFSGVESYQGTYYFVG